MGSQFKTILPKSTQTPANIPPSGSNASEQAGTQTVQQPGLKPLFRLPVASLDTLSPGEGNHQSQPPLFEQHTIKTPRPVQPQVNTFSPAFAQVNARQQSVLPLAPFAQNEQAFGQQGSMASNTPFAPAGPFNFPSAQANAGEFRSEAASANQQAFSPRELEAKGQSARGQAPLRRHKRRNIAVVSVLVGCCLCLLFLASGGYWFSHANQAKVQSTPVVVFHNPDEDVVPTSIPASTPTPSPTPTLGPVQPSITASGKLILVSVSQQKLTAYDQGQPVFTTLVTTGMPALYTPRGTYYIFQRVTNAMFYSPWGKSSPYYYAPIHVNYGLKITNSGIYLHDATWRSEFGPGTDVPHNDPVYGQETGSHGCVELPLDAMKWIYNWSPLSTVVEVVN